MPEQKDANLRVPEPLAVLANTDGLRECFVHAVLCFAAQNGEQLLLC